MKIIKLCENELIKTLKKTSTKVMVILTLLSIIGAVGFTYLIKLLDDITENSMYEYSMSIDDEINQLNNELNQDKTLSEQSKGYIQSQIEMYQLAKECNIDINNSNNYDYWKVNLLYDIQNKKNDLVDLKLMNAEKTKIEKQQNKINKQIETLKNDNFDAYIEMQKENLKTMLDNKEIKQKEYALEIENWDLRKKYEIGKTDKKEENWKSMTFEEITTLKKNLLTGIDSNTKKVLTIKEQEKQKDAIKIDLYRLENNLQTIDSMSNFRGIYDSMARSFSSTFLSIMMIMIAGSSISTEISKGTIKFWTITPNKRWKILLSKIISAIVILLVMIAIISLFSELVGALLFRDNPAQDYLYIKDGEVRTINHYIYTWLFNLVMGIDTLVFVLFAVMLSTITRNTAASVGISIATYIGASTVMSIINMFVKYDFIKFIPFNNLNLVNKVFPNQVSYLTMQTAETMLNTSSLEFSLCVLGVCAILMIVTMFDSFNKRDIM